MASGDDVGETSSADQWTRSDRPARVSENFIYEVVNLPVEGETQPLPAASDYWPTAEDSINRRWDGPGTLSPAEKFERAFRRPGFASAISAKLGVGAAPRDRRTCLTSDDCAADNDGSVCVGTGKTKSCIPTWWGICHGVASSAVHERIPSAPIVYNGITFYPADIEALMGVLYAEGGVHPVSLPASCSASGTAKVTDQTGHANRECRVSDAGAWHVLVTNMIGLQHTGFVYDRTANLEVWNEPARGYTITNAVDGHLKEISKKDVYKLIGPNSNTVASTLAKRFFDVAMDFRYVKSARVSRSENAGTLTETAHFRYVLAVDADDRVVSGEWLGSTDGGDHPDFAWWPVSDPTKSAMFGMISYGDVKALTALADDPKMRTETRVLLSDFMLADVSKYLVIGAPEKTTVTVTMTGEGNADLYVRAGMYPSVDAYTCKSTGPTTSESCTVATAGSGVSYYIRVRPMKPGSKVTLTAKLVRGL